MSGSSIGEAHFGTSALQQDSVADTSEALLERQARLIGAFSSDSSAQVPGEMPTCTVAFCKRLPFLANQTKAVDSEVTESAARDVRAWMTR